MAIPCNCADCLNNAPVPKKKIAIIGSGASGLTVMKELTALGHEVGHVSANSLAAKSLVARAPVLRENGPQLAQEGPQGGCSWLEGA